MDDRSFFWAPCFDVGAIVGSPSTILRHFTQAPPTLLMVTTIVQLMVAILLPLDLSQASILPTMRPRCRHRHNSHKRRRGIATFTSIRLIRIMQPALQAWPRRLRTALDSSVRQGNPCLKLLLFLLRHLSRFQQLCLLRRRPQCRSHRHRVRLKQAPAAMASHPDQFFLELVVVPI